MASGNGFTPTERLIVDLLADGRPRTKKELAELMKDDMDVEGEALKAHLTNIRRKLQAQGFDLAAQFIKRTYHVRLIRQLASPYDGHT